MSWRFGIGRGGGRDDFGFALRVDDILNRLHVVTGGLSGRWGDAVFGEHNDSHHHDDRSKAPTQGQMLAKENRAGDSLQASVQIGTVRMKLQEKV